MKKTLLVMVLAVVLVLAFATTASAKYAGLWEDQAYISWDTATKINSAIVNAEAGTTMTAGPHGGYTQTSVKCAVCHSIHRAFSDTSTVGVGTDMSLLNNSTGACVQCHAAWGTNPSDSLVAVGQTYSGPHIGAGGSTCAGKPCHGSPHGIGADPKYAIVNKYNLQNNYVNGSWVDTATGNTVADTDNGSVQMTKYMDAVIAAGNTNGQIGTAATGDAMKAFATGYVCSPCHSDSSFSVAKAGFANPIVLGGDTVRTGHPSATGQFYGHAPTCEKCHDMVDVATNSTAFPHANRGIDVYADRFDYEKNVGNYGAGGVADLIYGGATIASTDNTITTRYTLWMTSGISDSTSAAIGPISPLKFAKIGNDEGGAFSLRDGACLKCHVTDGSLHSLP